MEVRRVNLWRSRLPNRERVEYWSRELRRFFSWQLAITGLNLLAGLLIIRFLPKGDYALYAIGFMTLSIFTDITDAGISPAVRALAGRHWGDRERMGSVVNTAVSFRKQVALATALPVAAYALWQFRLLEAGWGQALALTIVFGIGGLVGLETSIYRVPAVFSRKVIELQRFDGYTAVAKVGLIVACGLVYPSAWLFAVLSVATLVIDWRLVKRLGASLITRTAAVSREYRATMVGLFRPNILNSVFMAFQGQIALLLAALFGSASNVAELSAMGKIGVVFTILGSFVSAYLAPEVSKAVTPRGVLAKAALVIGLYLAAAAVVLGVAWLAPELVLWVLGPKYANVEGVLLLYLSVAMVGLLRAQVHALCISRGWVRGFFWYAPVVLAAQAYGIWRGELGTLRGIVNFEALVTGVAFAVTAGVFAWEWWRYRGAYGLETARP